MVHCKRLLGNREAVVRSWLMYSQDSDKAFCFRCKLFGNSASQCICSINTWKSFSKKLKEHEDDFSDKKFFNGWLLPKEDIRTRSTVNRQEMHIFLADRTFWRNV